MFDSLRSLFGGKKAVPRQLDHASQLQVGDLLLWTDSFGVPPDIRGQKFEVKAVNTYHFQHQASYEFSLLSANGQQYFLAITRDDAEESLSLCRSISRAQVEDCFDLNQFAQIFDGQGQARLQTQETSPASLEGWLAATYALEVFAEKAYYHQGDYRQRHLPSDDDTAEALDYYYLSGQPKGYGLEAEVYNHATEIYLSLHRPLSDIKELWPGHGG